MVLFTPSAIIHTFSSSFTGPRYLPFPAYLLSTLPALLCSPGPKPSVPSPGHRTRGVGGQVFPTVQAMVKRRRGLHKPDRQASTTSEPPSSFQPQQKPNENINWWAPTPGHAMYPLLQDVSGHFFACYAWKRMTTSPPLPPTTTTITTPAIHQWGFAFHESGLAATCCCQ